ncbi:MAG: LiaF domain-containing protein [Sphaerochaetaceae bacterium]
MKHNTAKWLVGLIIIIVGINLILKAAGISFSLFFKGWWAIPIIVGAIASIGNVGITPWNFGSLVLGCYLFAYQQDWIPSWLNFSYVIGSAVIGFGLLFIFNPNAKEDQKGEKSRSHHRYSSPHSVKSDDSSNPNYTAFFSGQEIKSEAKELESSTMFALFGGLSIDFSSAIITKDIVIDATSLFGGIDIKVPDNANVVVKSTPFFGGVENKVKPPVYNDGSTITIRCLAAFGGVSIS